MPDELSEVLDTASYKEIASQAVYDQLFHGED